jgi:hypothetical protein
MIAPDLTPHSVVLRFNTTLVIPKGEGWGMRKFLGVACFVGSFVFATASWAVDIQAGQGDLSVNQGQGFQPVNGRVDAKAGDSVMVSPGGSATVSYPDGCQVSIQPGAVTTIAPLSPCASGSFAQSPQLPDIPAGLIVGGVIVGGLAGVAIYEGTKSTSSPPASP